MSHKFWIVTISADNLEIARTRGLIGLPAKRVVYRFQIEEGDAVVFYISKKRVGDKGYNAIVCEFGPIARLTSSVFYDDSLVWNSRNDERYPWRWRISVTLDKRISARSIVGNLSFTHDKPKWGLYFLVGVRQVSEDDFMFIQRTLEGSTNR